MVLVNVAILIFELALVNGYTMFIDPYMFILDSLRNSSVLVYGYSYSSDVHACHPCCTVLYKFSFYIFTLTFVVEITHNSNMIYVVCFVSRYSCTSDTVS